MENLINDRQLHFWEYSRFWVKFYSFDFFKNIFSFFKLFEFWCSKAKIEHFSNWNYTKRSSERQKNGIFVVKLIRMLQQIYKMIHSPTESLLNSRSHFPTLIGRIIYTQIVVLVVVQRTQVQDFEFGFSGKWPEVYL